MGQTLRRAPALFVLLAVALGGCAMLPASLGGGPATPPPHPQASTSSGATRSSLKGLPPGEPPPPDFESSHTPLVHWKDLVFKPRPGIRDIWQVLRSGFRLTGTMNPRVRVELNWYIHHPGYMERTATRAKPYLYFILKSVRKRHLPAEIALLPIVESAYDPYAYSWAHAAGLWQFIPSTARHFGIKINWWFDGRRDLIQSTRSALNFLSELHAQFGSWLLALAAYNSGAVTVEDAIQENQRLGRPTDFWNLDLPAATEAYVPRLLAVRDIIEHARRYGIHLPKIPDTPYLSVVKLKGQLDLSLAAHLLGMSLQKLYLLNPGFNRWATDPDGPNRLLVPRDRLARFLTGLHKLGTRQLVAWVPYRIQPGNALSVLAMRFGTTVRQLREKNGLPSDLIRVGEQILVPSSNEHLSEYVPFGAPAIALERTAPVGATQVDYRVEPGDSLWSIAQAYHVSVAALANWNHLTSASFIQPGQTLLVWHNVASSKPLPAPRSGIYTVQPGDSLWSIAHEYGIPLLALAHWNHITPQSFIQPGQELALTPSHVAQATQETLTSALRGQHVVYTVRPGDSLWSISQTYNVPLLALARWNHISPGTLLHPGQRLSLWDHGQAAPLNALQRITYTVRPGDSLSRISERFDVSMNQLGIWNHVTPSQLIYPGERLTLYVDVAQPNRG